MADLKPTTRVNIPLIQFLSLAGFLVAASVSGAWSVRSILSEIKSLKGALERVEQHRFDRLDMQAWCYRAAKLNNGFTCPDMPREKRAGGRRKPPA